MAACEKCWADAGERAYLCGGDKVDRYHEILKEREDNPCSPEEQCGEMHLVLQWKDGRPDQCRCGRVVESKREEA